MMETMPVTAATFVVDIMNDVIIDSVVLTTENATTADLCAIYENYTLVRFIYIVLATILSIAGFVANILLLVIFAKRSCATTPPTLYPSALALVDALICISYTLMFGADAIISYLRIESLFILYYFYIVPAFVLSRIAQLAVPYMLIFATLERLNWISDRRKDGLLRRIYSREGRYACVITTFTVCIILRLPTAWAIEVEEYPDCPDFFRTLTTGSAAWTNESELWYFFDFHILVMAQTFLPFFVLIGLNWIIVRKLRKPTAGVLNRGSSANIHDIEAPFKNGAAIAGAVLLPQPGVVRSMQSQVRSAIITMGAIVTSYLVCNSLHLVLTILERSGSSLLMDPEDPLLSSTFHTTFSDLISFVYMFTSGIRLCIYAAVNAEFRADLFGIFRSGPRPQQL